MQFLLLWCQIQFFYKDIDRSDNLQQAYIIPTQFSALQITIQNKGKKNSCNLQEPSNTNTTARKATFSHWSSFSNSITYNNIIA